ncbi:uncharacterized protein LOC142094851 [Mixophyes fleayi]|uniref:uncharacterized protein LOC142094851 n=1 Tax=Mixophyes fleayi TaxID=3061075 RepID=UPI003F4DAFCF
MEKKRLRVDGIPTDISSERVKDKLTIHFLRTRNGGGEVESIDIIPGTQPYAIVTFEEDKVAEMVLRIKNHTLQVNDKAYKLVVSEVIGKLELDEVFQKLSLTVHYKRFPENCRNVLKNMRKTHRDVKFDFNEKTKTCDISGTYTEIQTLVQEIVNKLDIGYESLKQDLFDMQKRAKSDQSILRHRSDLQGIPQVADQRSMPLSASAEQTRYVQKNETIEQLQEPFVWDADIYKYIQFHSLEYKEILSKYQVQAVDESSDGITTLYLQTVTGGLHNLANLRAARFNLMGLYQGLALLLRKEQIDKRGLNGDQDFHRSLLRDLQSLYPMLLCHEDEQYLFLIGNGLDVGQGKQYISDAQSKFDKPTSALNPLFSTQPAGTPESTTREDLLKSISPSYKHERSEAKVGNRIAATFSLPTDHSSYSTRTQLDERYLTSSNSNSRHLLDHEKYPNSDKTAETMVEYTAAKYLKNEDFSLSQTDEKSGSKSLPPFKKLDVLPALKTGREDIRQSRSTTKSSGPLKPVRFTKASSELLYSSLVDVDPPPVDFKISEGKLRRSNSLSRIYTRENASSVQQGDIFPFTDEILAQDWLWHYIKEFHKSDIEIACTEVLLMEEQYNGNIILKLKAVSKSKLTMAKENIQLLYWKESVNITSSSLDYSTLGIKGPDDSAVYDWCNLFRSYSQKLCIKVEKDKLLIIYPKEYSQLVVNKIRSHRNLPLVVADDGQTSVHFKTMDQMNKPDSTGDNNVENRIGWSKSKYTQPQPLSSELSSQDAVSETNDYQGMRCLEDQKSSQFDSTDTLSRIANETKTFFSNIMPPYQEENIQTSPHPKELQDYIKGNSFLQEQDYFKSKSSFFENPQTDLYTSKHCSPDFKAAVKTYDQGLDNTTELLAEQLNSPSQSVKNRSYLETDSGEKGILQEGSFPQFESSSSELRSPAVGQESEKTDTVCDLCKNSSKVVKVSCGHYLCDNCHSTTMDPCGICLASTASKDKDDRRIIMTHTSMSLSLPGYERDTSFKIMYEVSDGVQGVGDPNPGCPYKGGRFEAYLPDNREGKKLLLLLEKALSKGLTFHIKTLPTGDKVTWHRIPHKIYPDGGKIKNGYPDSAYIKSTMALLKDLGIE